MPRGRRNTTTGSIWERTIDPALTAKYPGFQKQVRVGQQLFGGEYVADFVVDGIVVSAKWQQVGGTVEQKLLYDIASLIDVVRHSNAKFRKAYVVLGGTGFRSSTRNFLLAQGHRQYLREGDLVEVVSLDDFIGRVNRRTL